MRIEIKLTDANGVATKRAVTLGWLLGYVKGLVRSGRSFTIITDGGRIYAKGLRGNQKG